MHSFAFAFFFIWSEINIHSLSAFFFPILRSSVGDRHDRRFGEVLFTTRDDSMFLSVADLPSYLYADALPVTAAIYYSTPWTPRMNNRRENRERRWNFMTHEPVQKKKANTVEDVETLDKKKIFTVRAVFLPLQKTRPTCVEPCTSSLQPCFFLGGPVFPPTRCSTDARCGKKSSSDRSTNKKDQNAIGYFGHLEKGERYQRLWRRWGSQVPSSRNRVNLSGSGLWEPT